MVYSTVRGIVIEVAQEAEPALDVGLSRGVERVVVDTGRWAWDLAVVGLRV